MGAVTELTAHDSSCRPWALPFQGIDGRVLLSHHRNKASHCRAAQFLHSTTMTGYSYRRALLPLPASLFPYVSVSHLCKAWSIFVLIRLIPFWNFLGMQVLEQVLVREAAAYTNNTHMHTVCTAAKTPVCKACGGTTAALVRCVGNDLHTCIYLCSNIYL